MYYRKFKNPSNKKIPTTISEESDVARSSAWSALAVVDGAIERKVDRIYNDMTFGLIGYIYAPPVVPVQSCREPKKWILKWS